MNMEIRYRFFIIKFEDSIQKLVKFLHKLLAFILNLKTDQYDQNMAYINNYISRYLCFPT